jgi:hypothetical protein
MNKNKARGRIGGDWQLRIFHNTTETSSSSTPGEQSNALNKKFLSRVNSRNGKFGAQALHEKIKRTRKQKEVVRTSSLTKPTMVDQKHFARNLL